MGALGEEQNNYSTMFAKLTLRSKSFDIFGKSFTRKSVPKDETEALRTPNVVVINIFERGIRIILG